MAEQPVADRGLLVVVPRQRPKVPDHRQRRKEDISLGGDGDVLLVAGRDGGLPVGKRMRPFGCAGHGFGDVVESWKALNSVN